jgi:hypothetical protein
VLSMSETCSLKSSSERLLMSESALNSSLGSRGSSLSRQSSADGGAVSSSTATPAARDTNIRRSKTPRSSAQWTAVSPV